MGSYRVLHGTPGTTRSTSRTTKTAPRNTRITSRTIRTLHINSPANGGLVIWKVLMVLDVILVFLVVILVVLEVTPGAVLRHIMFSVKCFSSEKVSPITLIK